MPAHPALLPITHTKTHTHTRAFFFTSYIQALKVGDLKDGMALETVSKHKLHACVDRAKGTSFEGATETAKVVAADLQAGQVGAVLCCAARLFVRL